MKVGIFTDSYALYHGVVTSISTFKEELNKLGHEIYIFAPSYPNYEDEEAGVYRYFSMSSPTNPDFALAIQFIRYAHVAEKLDLDIIHSLSFYHGSVGMLG